MTYIAAAVVTPGVVRHAANNAVTLGEIAGGRSERVETVAALIRAGGIEANVSDDIQRDLWTKLMMFSANGGVLAVCRSAMGAVLGDADTRALYLAVVSEVEAVARRRGVALPADAAARVMAIADGFPGHTESSMLRDVKAGNRLELEPVHGAIVRLGAQLGVPTPACRFVYAALKLHSGGTSRA
jgi:2-dehydropantoate 2-reductase